MADFARRLDGVPVVASTSDRNSLYPSPSDNQRVFNLETGNVERWDGTAWITDLESTSAVLPGDDRTTDTLAELLANNAFFNPLDYANGATIGDGTTDARAAFAAVAVATAGPVTVFPGTYAIASDLTLSCPLTMQAGAVLKPANGVTVTLGGAVTAGLYQIFDCSAGGSIVVATPTSHNGIDIVMNPVWFGADMGPFANDGTSAFQKCFASKAVRYVLPANAQFDISDEVDIDIAVGQRCIIEGAGPSSRIDFDPTANDKSLFKATTGDNILFRNFEINCNNSGSKTGLVGFDMANGGLSALSFDRVTVSGFNAYGIKLTGAKYLQISRCRFLNHIAAVGQPVAIAVGSTTWINSGEIHASQFSGNDKCIRTTGFEALSIIGNSFEGDGATSLTTLDAIIQLDWDGTDAAAGLVFRGNYVEDERPAIGYGFLHLTGVAGAVIEGNAFTGEFGGTKRTGIFVSVNGSLGRGVSVRNNRFYTVKDDGGYGGYFIQANSQLVRAHDNAYHQQTTGELTTYNDVMARMSGKVEVNNFLTSTTVDLGSLSAAASQISSDIAITGLEMGDFLEVSQDDLTTGTQGIMFQGYVASAGNARIVWFNPTAGSIDLGSTDWWLRVRKRDT